MEQQVRLADLVERGLERLDEAVRQLVDEADGVGERGLAALGQAQPARRGVQRREQHVRLQDAGVRQRVEQRGLAGVGVADERHAEDAALRARTPLELALARDALELALEHADALARQAAVGLELRLTGADVS